MRVQKFGFLAGFMIPPMSHESDNTRKICHRDYDEQQIFVHYQANPGKSISERMNSVDLDNCGP